MGKCFDGTQKDTNFWTETVSGSGSVAQSGEVVMNTGITANSTVQYQSTQQARYIGSEANECRIINSLNTVGTANNIRRWGAYTTDISGVPRDGLYFELNGTTFSVNHVIGGAVTAVLSGSFKGLYGPTFSPDITQHRYTIEYTTTSAYFGVDDQLLHAMQFSGSKLGVNYDFNVTLQNINSGGLASSVIMDVYSGTICRMGTLRTQPSFRNITAAGTYNLKYGPGVLNNILIGGAGSGNPVVAIYDDTTGTATPITTLTMSGGGFTYPQCLPCDTFFQNGLKLVVTGTPQITINWE